MKKNSLKTTPGSWEKSLRLAKEYVKPQGADEEQAAKTLAYDILVDLDNENSLVQYLEENDIQAEQLISQIIRDCFMHTPYDSDNDLQADFQDPLFSICCAVAQGRGKALRHRSLHYVKTEPCLQDRINFIAYRAIVSENFSFANKLIESGADLNVVIKKALFKHCDNKTYVIEYALHLLSCKTGNADQYVSSARAACISTMQSHPQHPLTYSEALIATRAKDTLECCSPYDRRGYRKGELFVLAVYMMGWHCFSSRLFGSQRLPFEIMLRVFSYIFPFVDNNSPSPGRSSYQEIGLIVGRSILCYPFVKYANKAYVGDNEKIIQKIQNAKNIDDIKDILHIEISKTSASFFPNYVRLLRQAEQYFIPRH